MTFDVIRILIELEEITKMGKRKTLNIGILLLATYINTIVNKY